MPRPEKRHALSVGSRRDVSKATMSGRCPTCHAQVGRFGLGWLHAGLSAGQHTAADRFLQNASATVWLACDRAEHQTGMHCPSSRLGPWGQARREFRQAADATGIVLVLLLGLDDPHFQCVEPFGRSSTARVITIFGDRSMIEFDTCDMSWVRFR